VTGLCEFIVCSKGKKISGDGKTFTFACKIDLGHPDPTSPNKSGSVTILATANTCTGIGTAVVKIGLVTHVLLDPNINDNTCNCP
jgi:hypothetical protein